MVSDATPSRRTRSTTKQTAKKSVGKTTAKRATEKTSAGNVSSRRPGEQTKGARAREINAGVRYAMWSTFALSEPLGGVDRVVIANGVTRALAPLVDAGAVEIRGWYDVGGLRADADIMVWWHAEDVAQVQEAYHRLRGSALGRHLTPVWSQVALHRPAEFNKSHVPAFLAGEEPKRFISVYPFVRSYEWYLLPDEERREMLKEHGMMARDYPDVRANTVASFSLGDYEWILAFEADELYRIVDLMRHLRGSTAGRHVREETPFFTGRRLGLTELLQTLP